MKEDNNIKNQEVEMEMTPEQEAEWEAYTKWCEEQFYSDPIDIVYNNEYEKAQF